MAWHDAALVGILNDVIETDCAYKLPKTAGAVAHQFLVTQRATPLHISASIESRQAVANETDREPDSPFSILCHEVRLSLEDIHLDEHEGDHFFVERSTATAIMSMLLDPKWEIEVFSRINDTREDCDGEDDD
jgi:hypothetical protein